MPVPPDRIVEYLRHEADRPLKAKELAKGLALSSDEYDEFRDQLRRLEEQGVLYRAKKQRYAVPRRLNLVVGRLQVIRSGSAFLIPDDDDKDVFVPAEELGSALHGDRAVVRVEKRRKRERPQGTVIRVLERARTSIVGVYHPKNRYGFVVPEDQKLNRDVFVPPDAARGASDGDVVVVDIEDWGDEKRGPAGSVREVLGRFGEPGVDVLAVIHGHELPLAFPEEVEREAEAVRARGVAAGAEGRVDLRGRLIFTIDPEDAKDHDDALSVQSLEDGGWEVGVHIADVAHYVEEGGAIDREALTRATSVYLVDRVIPMLPEALSADLCSLRPHEDRFAVSTMITLDADADVVSHRLVRTLIRSAHRLSYDDAQAVLDGNDSVDAETDAAIRSLGRISALLREKRHARGSLDFDLPQARVILNTKGEPTDIERVMRLESHRLVEDFMLLANHLVARDAVSRKLNILHRVHEAPDPDRMDQLRETLAGVGLQLKAGDVKPKHLQKVLAGARGRPEENLVNTVVLRSMKQARYSERNLGHFGLATDHYTHFTSPIRRYPDLIVHRVLTRAILDGVPVSELPDREALAELGRHTSERERVAVDAERDSVDLKKVEFMERHIGDRFSGTISGVKAFGFFVLLDDFFVEGLVHVSSLEDDYYVFQEERHTLVGEHRRRQFRLGDPVRVTVSAVDIEQRNIDFVLAGDDE